MYHARFSGTHYEAGLRWGRALARRGQFIARQPTFTVSEERRAFARGCLPAYREYFPEILEEIRGIAEGQGADSDDFAAFLFSMYAYGFGHCTCFAYADENSAMPGRNSDFLTSLEGLYMNCLYAVDGSRAFNANTTAFAEVEDGMNECGLAAGLTFVYPEERGFGLNAGMLVRLILEKCATAREALGLLCAVPSASQRTVRGTSSSPNAARGRSVSCGRRKGNASSLRQTIFSPRRCAGTEAPRGSTIGTPPADTAPRANS